MLSKAEWDELSDLGEEYTIPAIKKYLLTQEQRDFLTSNDYDIADILNGRFRYDQMDEVKDKLFKPWNDKLGWVKFRF